VISALAELTGYEDQDVAQLAEIVSHEPALRTLELAAQQVEDGDLTLSVQYCRELFDNAALRWYSTQNVEGYWEGWRACVRRVWKRDPLTL
jgi:hypothetical protein